MKNIILLSMLFVMFIGVVYGAIVATGGEHADMTGNVVGVCVYDNNSIDSNSILIEGVLTHGNQYGNISVRITDDTQIFFKEGNKRRPASFENIKPGQNVAVIFKGPILQSYPPQATGRELIIKD